MSSVISEECIDFIEKIIIETKESKADITFHGGEPLLAGIEYYKDILPKIKRRLNNKVSIGVQTNLFNINDDLVSIFKEYNVSIGTSLDGPEEINDYHRNREYFRKNRKSREIIRNHGICIGCIATFTKHSGSKLNEVFRFF